MKIIRTINVAAALLLLLFTCGACKDWLSVSPKSQVKYDDLFTTPNGFKDQLTGIYTALCSGDLYGANLTYGAIDAAGQYYYLDRNRTNKYYYMTRWDYENSQSKGIIESIWNKMYNTIANVNILLKGLDEHSGVLSSQEEAVYRGEALALRAFLHFDLLRMFGKSHLAGANEKAIPYLEAISKQVTPLSTVDEVLGYVIRDLEEAASLLEADPIKTGETGNTFLGTRTYHLNYYAVKALLARVYLYRGDKDKALTHASEVINVNKFPWVAQNSVTTTERKDRDGIFVTENIFMLNNTLLNDLANTYLRPGMADAQQDILIVDGDVKTVVFETEKYGTLDWRNTYYFDMPDWYGYNTRLWQYDNMPNAYKNKQPMLRISEMYLIAAECTTDRNAAIGYLNTLRNHRGLTTEFDLTADLNDKAWQQEIAKEYHKEFWGDGQWFFYLKRTDADEIPNALSPFNKSFYCFPMTDLEKEYGNRDN